jgi:hypothetical protein
MHRMPIGPTGAAIENPMRMLFASKLKMLCHCLLPELGKVCTIRIRIGQKGSKIKRMVLKPTDSMQELKA